MTSILRPLYLDKIRPLLGTSQIKVITGMRRAGKSVFLRQIMDELRSSGVAATQICAIDMEDLAFDELRTYQELAAYIEAQCQAIGAKKYLFIDEVQEIDGWERVVRHFAKRDDFEVFITGSNSHLLSSELSTMLAGRFVSIHVHPLCYREFLQFRPDSDFNEFVLLGGLPGVVTLSNAKAKQEALEGILHTVLFRDVIARFEVRSGALLADVLKFIAGNIGHPTTTQSIVAYLKSERLSLAFETVRDYLLHYASAFLVHAVAWEDAVGKRSLNLNQKYYFADLGLRHRLVAMRDEHRGQVLENVVYNELLVRGYQVTIGRVKKAPSGAENWEIDFIAQRQTVDAKGGLELDRRYIQVCYLLASAETVEREYRSLRAIADHYPKLVLSMDTDFAASSSDHGGIKRQNLVDWLLEND
jgi:hypothetical protein